MITKIDSDTNDVNMISIPEQLYRNSSDYINPRILAACQQGILCKCSSHIINIVVTGTIDDDSIWNIRNCIISQIKSPHITVLK